MKNTELFDKHADRRSPVKKKKAADKEDVRSNRAARISFKNYIRELEESLLEEDLDEDLDAE